MIWCVCISHFARSVKGSITSDTKSANGKLDVGMMCDKQVGSSLVPAHGGKMQAQDVSFPGRSDASATNKQVFPGLDCISR